MRKTTTRLWGRSGRGRRRRRVELGSQRTPGPMGLGMTHISMEDDEEPRRRSSARSYFVIDNLFECLMAVSTQLASTVELSSTLEAPLVTACAEQHQIVSSKITSSN